MAALYTAAGTTNRIAIAASASINNLSAGSMLIWLYLTTLTPAAQGNFWGKSTAGNRFVGFITNTGIVNLEIGGSTLCQITVTSANTPWLAASKWWFAAFTWNIGTAVPRLYGGDLLHPATEVSTYTNQAQGVFGTHDDSAAGLNLMNASGAPPGSSSPPEDVALQQLYNTPLTPEQIIRQQFALRASKREPGCVGFWCPGAKGGTAVVDESGWGNHGIVTGPTVAVDQLPWPAAPASPASRATFGRARLAL